MNELLIGVATTVLCTLLSGLMSVAIVWLRKKLQVESSCLRLTVGDEIERLATIAVKSLNQTIVDESKEDGTWTRDRGLEVLTDATKFVLQNLKPEAGRSISRVTEELINYVTNVVESKVSTLKCSSSIGENLEGHSTFIER